MKQIIVVGVVLVAAAINAACTQQSYANDDTTKTRVGIVYDIGGKDDRSFNAAAFRGVRCAETGKFPDGTACGKPALGIVLSDVEPGSPVDIEPDIRSLDERSYGLVIGSGIAATSD